MAPSLYIVVRTRHVDDVRQLLDLGADEVIPEEFETSVRIFSRVLAKYTLPESDIDTLTKVVRGNGYRMFSRSSLLAPAGVQDPEKMFGDLHIHTLEVGAGAPSAGKTLRQLDPWNTRGVGILAVRRGTSSVTSPHPDLIVLPGDVLILYGSDKNIRHFLPLVTGPAGTA
jgi:CPA2 family monovalent cation:H+ antiporter-2